MSETTTQAPGSRPAPALDVVWPLLARYQIALVPHRDRSWDVLAGFDGLGPLQGLRGVAFAGLPAAIAAVAARCAQTEGEA